MAHDFKDILYTVERRRRHDHDQPAGEDELGDRGDAARARGRIRRGRQRSGSRRGRFTGAGEKAFCAGADVSWQKEGKMGRGGPAMFTPPYLMISRCPKPVIARVNGYAIGGGHHFAYFCDFTIAAEHAVFGQSEPRVAYPASGPTVNYLTRIVGHKRAREIWMLGRRYSAQQMYEWGLVNAVVPLASLDEEVAKWCDELLAVSPTCLKVYKASFIEEFQDLMGQGDLLRRLLVPPSFRDTEQREGTSAFLEKRRPDYSRFRKPQ